MYIYNILYNIKNIRYRRGFLVPREGLIKGVGRGLYRDYVVPSGSLQRYSGGTPEVLLSTFLFFRAGYS